MNLNGKITIDEDDGLFSRKFLINELMKMPRRYIPMNHGYWKLEIRFWELPALVQTYFLAEDTRGILENDEVYFIWNPMAYGDSLICGGPSLPAPQKNPDDEIVLIRGGKEITKRDFLKATGEWQDETLQKPAFPIFRS